jgi:hypothetical protein
MRSGDVALLAGFLCTALYCFALPSAASAGPLHGASRLRALAGSDRSALVTNPGIMCRRILHLQAFYRFPLALRDFLISARRDEIDVGGAPLRHAKYHPVQRSNFICLYI